MEVVRKNCGQHLLARFLACKCCQCVQESGVRPPFIEDCRFTRHIWEGVATWLGNRSSNQLRTYTPASDMIQCNDGGKTWSAPPKLLDIDYAQRCGKKLQDLRAQKDLKSSNIAPDQKGSMQHSGQWREQNFYLTLFFALELCFFFELSLSLLLF